jgi:ATP-dependent Lon protease
MEIIEIPGYSDIEKYHIAQRFLIPKQLKENGLDEASIRFQKDAVYKLIHDYTMESGVRNLERIIASVLRKIAREYLRKQNRPPLSEFTRVVTSKSISRYIGRQIITDDEVIHSDKPGIAHGLAWTETGGRLLSVETALMKGEGKLILTGNLGDVMKESARISFSYLESNAERYGIDPELFKTCDVHIHVPQGAIPKDGPSAGITLTAALASAFRKQPLRSGFSMTGEISLTGNIYPIGGIKEKLLASYRHDLFSILLPEDNQKDVEEDIPSEIVQEMHIHYISTIDEALKILLPPFEHKAS